MKIQENIILSHRTWQLGLLIMIMTIGSVPFQAYAANSALVELFQRLKHKRSITEAEDEKPVATAQPDITRQAPEGISANFTCS